MDRRIHQHSHNHQQQHQNQHRPGLRLRPLILVSEDTTNGQYSASGPNISSGQYLPGGSFLDCLKCLRDTPFSYETDLGGRKSTELHFYLEFDRCEEYLSSEANNLTEDFLTGLDSQSDNLSKFLQEAQQRLLLRRRFKDPFGFIDTPVACLHVTSISNGNLEGWLRESIDRVKVLSNSLEMLHVAIPVIPTAMSLEDMERIVATTRKHVVETVLPIKYGIGDDLFHGGVLQRFLHELVNAYLIPYALKIISKGQKKEESTNRLGKVLFSLGKKLMATESHDLYMNDEERENTIRSFDYGILLGATNRYEIPNWFSDEAAMYYRLLFLRDSLSRSEKPDLVLDINPSVLVKKSSRLLHEMVAFLVEVSQIADSLSKEEMFWVGDTIFALRDEPVMSLVVLLSWGNEAIACGRRRHSLCYLAEALSYAKSLKLVRIFYKESHSKV